MAAARCSTCGISFPFRFTACQVCGENLAPFENETVDSDWAEEVERVKATARFRRNEGDRIEAWRLQVLLDAGYTADDAEEISKRWSGEDAVDLHEAVALIEKHRFPPDLAALVAL